jgi:putative glutamine transport system substrate-binding protein
VGFDIDLARELARRWLGDSGAVQFRQVRSDTAVEHLRAGDVDLVLAALLRTVEREEQVDFGPTYFVDGHALLVRTTEETPILSPGDLEGRRVGVVDLEAEEALQGATAFTPTLQYYETVDEVMGAMARLEIDAVADLRRRLVRGLSVVPNSGIVGQHTEAVVAPAFAHNEPGLANLVTLTFQDMFVDGTYRELYEEWFPRDMPHLPEVWPGAAAFSLQAAAETPPARDALSMVRTGGWLRVAMVSNRSPFAYLDANGEPAGFEVRLVRLMAQRWLGDATAVEFLPVTLEDGLRLLETGEVDLMIGAVRHTQEAELRVDFSLTTYVGGEGVMLLSGSDPLGIADLNGQAVAAVSGTGSADALQRIGQELGISVVVYPKATLDEAIAALEAGEVVAVIGERIDMLGPAYATPGVGVSADRLTTVPLALALPPGDSAFRDLVNLTLQVMAREGQYAALYTEWFDDDVPLFDPWPGEPTRPLRIEVIPLQ